MISGRGEFVGGHGSLWGSSFFRGIRVYPSFSIVGPQTFVSTLLFVDVVLSLSKKICVQHVRPTQYGGASFVSAFLMYDMRSFSIQDDGVLMHIWT